MKHLVLLTALTLSSSALAQYKYLSFRMFSSNANKFSYYVDDRTASPGGISQSAAKAATERGWASWNAVSCAAPKAESKGNVNGLIPNPGDTYDIYSVMPIFVTSVSDADYNRAIGSDFVVGVTVPLAYAGILQTCDIFANFAKYQFSVADSIPANAVDLESVMVHEEGHCLGIDHPPFNGYPDALAQVMGAAVSPGYTRRTLGNHDIQALCAMNPATGAAAAPCGTNDVCNSGLSCVTQTASGQQPRKFCSRGCNAVANEDCPPPLVCTASALFSGKTGACLFPTNNVTPIGKDCNSILDCNTTQSSCIDPEPSTSGHTNWAAGYCTQTCEPGRPPCPAGSTCTLMQNNVQLCLKACRPGFADCRPEYACVQASTGGVCAPRCYTNADCGDANYDCRTCDGVCVPKQNVTGQIGDLCTSSQTCGLGQICAQLTATNEELQCTSQCGRGCGTCPSGSTCHPLPNGELQCIRDCTGPNTCPSGQRCADLAGGRGCVPACHNEAQCPVGTVCSSGECIIPGQNCGSLCEVPDSGKPIVIPKKDAGTGGGPGNAGCGCSSPNEDGSSAGFPLFVLMVVAVAVIRRSRS